MKHMISAFAAATLAVGMSAGVALAGDIQVEAPWARASAGMPRAGAAFMTIENAGAADQLVAASTNVSETAELHTHIKDGGVMRMRPVDAIDIPAHGSVSLQPGGLHVMLIDLKAPLKEGESFPLTLTFEHAGTMTVDVMVKGAGAMGPGHQHQHGTMK